MALVGGNCSIQGFDASGAEVYWTVTGDNVSTMTFCDVDEDGELELLVGSDDFEIRIFRNDEVRRRVAPCPMSTPTAPRASTLCARTRSRHRRNRRGFAVDRACARSLSVVRGCPCTKSQVISETTETDRIVGLCRMRRHTFGCTPPLSVAPHRRVRAPALHTRPQRLLTPRGGCRPLLRSRPPACTCTHAYSRYLGWSHRAWCRSYMAPQVCAGQRHRGRVPERWAAAVASQNEARGHFDPRLRSRRRRRA